MSDPIVPLTERERARASALAPPWWKDCWNIDHHVAIERIGDFRIEFSCTECRTSSFVIASRERLA